VKPKQAGKKEGGLGEGIFARLPKRSPAALLVQSRSQQKSFLFLLEEKIRCAQKKSRENFFAGWRALASGGWAERQSSQSGFSSKKVRILTKRHRLRLAVARQGEGGLRSVFYFFIMNIFYLFFFVVLAFSGTAVYACYRAAPWAPTFKKDIKRFLKLADIKPGQKVYDLGCGDGRLVLAAGQAGGRAVGFEVSLLPYLVAKWRIFYSPFRKRCQIIFKDFWQADLSDTDIVYFFLMPKIYAKMKDKLERELKPGAKVIVYAWPIEDWSLLAADCPKGKIPLYLYQL